MLRVEIKSLFCLILISLLFASISFAAETLTITAYFPPPYGDFEELHCEDLYLRKSNHADAKKAFSQTSGSVLRINPSAEFTYTRFDNPVTMDEGLTVGFGTITTGAGYLKVQNDVTIGDDLFVDDVYIDDDIRIDDELQMRYSGSDIKFLNIAGNVKFNTSDGYKGISYRKYFNASGDTLCATRYYAIPDPAGCNWPYAQYNWVCYDPTGYMFCVRNSD